MLLNLSDVFVKSLKNKTIMIRIIIDDNKEVDIKTTKGLEETELAANAVVEIMRNMVDQHEPKDNGKCDLVLVWVDQNRKLLAVKELKENLDLWLRDAKGYIDSYCAGKKSVLLTGYEDEVTKVAKKLESSECLKVCISKH